MQAYHVPSLMLGAVESVVNGAYIVVKEVEEK